MASFRRDNPGLKRSVLALSGEAMTEMAQRYVDIGFRHVLFHMPQPYDDETLERFANEVKQNLHD